MSKEALQGHKDKHAEKLQTLEQLVLQLRQKMAEGATSEGDEVWAQRLAEERTRRENLQSELDRLAVMFERVEKEVQRQRGPEAHMVKDAEERAREAEDTANSLKDENMKLRGQIRGLESKVARIDTAPAQQEAVPAMHLGALEELRTQVSKLTDACQVANGKLLVATRDCRLKDDIIAGLRASDPGTRGGGRQTGQRDAATMEQLQDRLISLTRTVNDAQNMMDDAENLRKERQGLLNEIEAAREANRVLEKQNESLASTNLRARTALQDVDAAAAAVARLKSELSACQQSLKNARQTITNLQGVNQENTRSLEEFQRMEEEKGRATEAYTAVESQMRSATMKMQETEEIAAGKEQHYQKIISTLRASLEEQKEKTAKFDELVLDLRRAHQVADDGAQGLTTVEQHAEKLRNEAAALKHENASLAKSVQQGKQAADKVIQLEEELQRRQQNTIALESEIKRQRDELNRVVAAHSQTGVELGENKNIINALQERVSSVSGQLHQRTNELQAANKDLAEQREYFRAQRQEAEQAKGEVTRLEHQSAALQQRLNKVEEESGHLQEAYQRTMQELTQEREQKDEVLTRALAAEKDLSSKSVEAAEYLARVQDMEQRIAELSLGVKSKDESLAKMVSTRQSLAVEVAAMREDGEYLREQLDEGGSQLQVAHSRILTLEARIRENEAQLMELGHTKDLLKEREDDCQNLALKISEQQNEKHHTEDMLQLLQVRASSLIVLSFSEAS